ncbi:hypothetical protein AB1Y20_022479 [Prymnesium parvum]|uniref:CRAL-TRIO domain-containing protein n=1 Tax=Prymnesium parvum TaxID=97485 RepID=A0AB34JGC4_PRYPA
MWGALLHLAFREREEQLTAEELRWILQVRDALDVAALPYTNAELVQLAFISKGRSSEAVSRLQKILSWRKQYELDAISFEAAFRTFNRTASARGAGNLCAMGRVRSGALGVCASYSDFLPSKMVKQHAFKATMGVFEACSSSLADVRRGVCLVAECGKAGFDNFSLWTELQMASLYVKGYPIRINRIVVVDASPMVRALLRGLMSALSSKMRRKLHLVGHDEFLQTYVANTAELPRFLGGGGTHGPSLVNSSLAQWQRLLLERAAWNARLVAQYGERFDKLSG